MRKFNVAERPFPDVGRLCVMVPVCTESRLRFRAALREEPEVEVGLV
jgi:hypothetical protein